jgi:hypothetical protein
MSSFFDISNAALVEAFTPHPTGKNGHKGCKQAKSFFNQM